MKRSLLLIAVALAAAPAEAKRGPERSELASYVRARAADAAGALEEASAGYAALLDARPGDEVLAVRAYRQALLAGDMALAGRAARTLDASNVLPADGRLLLFAETVAAQDWGAANAQLDRVSREASFDFLVPLMRAWLALGAKSGDPLAELDRAGRSGLAAGYAGEQRALLLLALGHADEGLTAVRALSAAGGRNFGLRIAAAARLAALGRRDAALSLLPADEPLLRPARSRIEAAKPLPDAVDSAADGLATLFVRLAGDVGQDRSSPLALSLTRIAGLLDPGNGQALLFGAQLLAAEEQNEAALALLGRVPAESAYAGAAADARVTLLVDEGDKQAALRSALAAAGAPTASVADVVRVGDLYTTLDRDKEAAAAYARAIELASADPGAKATLWRLWLLRGGAHEQAGDWAAALPALEKAAELAPDEPQVLNYLGYAQLERRENVEQAIALIARASALRPDDAAITDSLGWGYYLNGDVEKAVATLERAVMGQPGDPTINEHLGDAYWSAGRRYEARYAWRAASVYAEADAAARLAAKLETGLTPALAAP